MKKIKWVKLNTVKQQSVDGRFLIRKVYDRCFVVVDSECKIDTTHCHETLKEAKMYVEKEIGNING